MRRLPVRRPPGAVRAIFALLAAVGAVAVSSADEALYAVEVGERNRAAVRDEMAAQGLRWIGMLDTDIVLVRADEGPLSGLAGGLEFVRFGPERKIPAEMLPALDRASATRRGIISAYTVIPSDRSRSVRRRISAFSSALGGSAGLVESDALTMRVDLDVWALRQLLASPEVIWAEPVMAPSTDDYLVREFGGANYVELVDGFTGAGVVCEVVDGGLRTTHADFASTPPILRTANTTAVEHGTSTYGVLFGDGTSDVWAYGMIPDAVGLFSSYTNITDRDAHLASLAGPPYFGLLQSNSWGTGINRRYTAVSAEMDDSIFRREVVVLQSQSNNGNPDSRPEAWAKNVVSVGGVQGQGTLDRGDDAWGGLASTGPALDGRIKPDLVMFNDGIWTTASGSDTDYRLFTGTSAATPAVAGHFGIMFEMWGAGLFVQQAFSRDIQAEGMNGNVLSRPGVAMAKALMINSALAYEFDHVAEDLGRYRQGWGTPDLRRLRDDAGRTFVLDEAVSLVQDESWAGVFNVTPGEPDLRLTLVYSDPAGLPMAVSAIVNDLDLRVTSPSGVVYYGNAGLHDSRWSKPSSGPGVGCGPGVRGDRVNTVENVFVSEPEAGYWLVEVRAFRVNEDADDSTPEFDVPFALVVVGAEASASPALVLAGDIPEHLPAGETVVIEFDALGFEPDADGVAIVGSDAGESAVPLVWTGGSRLTATFSGLPCGSVTGLRFQVPVAGQSSVSYPPRAGGMIPVRVTRLEDVAPIGQWVVESSPGLDAGWWEIGVPGGGGLRWDPPVDADGNGICWLTDNRAGMSDVSGGTATLISPSFDLVGLHEYSLHYDVWVGSDDAGGAGEDSLYIEYSLDDGGVWIPLVEERATFRWVRRVVDLTGVVPAGSRVRFRFVIADDPDDSITEAAIDGLRVVADRCAPCPADYDGDGDVDLQDLQVFVDAFQFQDPESDFDGDGDVDLTDLLLFLFSFETGCES